MHPKPTVLSHLATKFSTHPENLATEALGFILASSGEARGVIVRLLASAGYQLTGDLEYTTQDSNDGGSRPDVVGRTSTGAPLVMLEAKFWAGLTAAQPNDYLRALPEDGGALLFVTPATRLEIVWAELKRRMQAAEFGFETPSHVGRDVRFVRVGARLLLITSWRKLLSGVLEAMNDANNTSAASDVRQLIALCEQMDSDAFLPLSADELTSTMVGRRITQFGDLANTVTDLLVKDGLASVKRLRATGGHGWYGRYLALKGHGALVCFNATRWSRWGESPLWIDLKGPDWKPSATVRDALTANHVLFRQSKTSGCLIPLIIPTDVEWDDVVKDVVEQVKRLAAFLPDISCPEFPPPPPPPNETPDDAAV